MDKILIAVLLAVAVVLVGVGPLILARHMAVSRHREQFLATGAFEFDMPTAREIEREEPIGQPATTADAVTAALPVLVVLDATTGETVRVGVDGLPLSEADVSARTASTTLTVDPERLAEILQLEKTAEYVLNPRTWAEVGAAEAFMRDPLGSPVHPPETLVQDAGNPALASAFWALINAGGLTTDWNDADGDFHFWDRDTALAGACG